MAGMRIVLATVIVLAGCGGGPVQPEASSSGAAALFTVTYRAKDGTVTSVDVPVESTRCRNLGETPFYSTSGPDGTTPPRASAARSSSRSTRPATKASSIPTVGTRTS